MVQQLLQQPDKYEVIATVRNEQVCGRSQLHVAGAVGTWWEGQQQSPAGHIARWLFCAAQQPLPICLPSSLHPWLHGSMYWDTTASSAVHAPPYVWEQRLP